MTQEKQTTILDSIQSEVSKEASPLLELLVKHARLIFLGLIALIVAIAVVGVWSYYSSGRQKEAEEALGKVIIMPDSADKIKALRACADQTGGGAKTSALLALMYSAAKQGEDETAALAWREIASEDSGAVNTIAEIAEAGSLYRMGKPAEAIALLDRLQARVTPAAGAVINGMIADMAESMGDWNKAIAAGENIISNTASGQDKTFWEQRIAYFQSKK